MSSTETAGLFKTAAPSEKAGSANRLPLLDVSTAHVAHKHRIDFWRANIGALFDVDLPGEASLNRFQGSIKVVNSGEILFGESVAQAQTFHRSRRRVASDGLDHFMVQTFVSGGGVMPDDSRVRPGDMLVIDLGRPHTRISTEYRNLSFVIPRDFDPVLSRLLERAHDRPLSKQSPFVRLFGDHMQSFWRNVGDLERSAARQVIRGSMAMLQTYLLSDGQITDEVDHSASEALGKMIRRYIETNLASDLRPEVLAARFRMSRAQLYRVFGAQGGVGRYIQEQRLKRSLVRLSDHSQILPSIGSVAFECGFKSESHFSRLFKERFGMTPGEARAEALRTNNVFNFQSSDFRAWVGSI